MLIGLKLAFILINQCVSSESITPPDNFHIEKEQIRLHNGNNVFRYRGHKKGLKIFIYQVNSIKERVSCGFSISGTDGNLYNSNIKSEFINKKFYINAEDNRLSDDGMEALDTLIAKNNVDGKQYRIRMTTRRHAFIDMDFEKKMAGHPLYDFSISVENLSK